MKKVPNKRWLDKLNRLKSKHFEETAGHLVDGLPGRSVKELARLGGCSQAEIPDQTT